MHKDKTRTRDIFFFSQKCNGTVCVHSGAARVIAQRLEEDNSVGSYETNIKLKTDQFAYISSIDIRPQYFQVQWSSDFLIRHKDGHMVVLEVVEESELSKRAVIEKLELSRRYWKMMRVAKWYVVVLKAGELV